MIGPYSENEISELDALEEALIDGQVPFGRMMKMYAEFLLACIWAGRFDEVFSSQYLSFIAKHLQVAITSFDASNSDELRRPGKHELWALSDRSEQEALGLAALSRCAVCCFHEDTPWHPDESESPTPLPFYLFLLKRVAPGMRMEFLRYAKAYLLAA
jgi:hypothetical protein